jgi:hypothetical protein
MVERGGKKLTCACGHYQVQCWEHGAAIVVQEQDAYVPKVMASLAESRMKNRRASNAPEQEDWHVLLGKTALPQHTGSRRRSQAPHGTREETEKVNVPFLRR